MTLERMVSWESEMTTESLPKGSLHLGDEKPHPEVESRCSENKDWSRRLLKTRFSDQNLDSLFCKYELRLHRGYFSIFLLVQTALSIAHISTLIYYVIVSSSRTAIVDILAYLGMELLLCLVTFAVFKRDWNKRHVLLPHFATAIAIGFTVLVDIALPLYHTAVFDSRLPLRPAYSTHTLIASHVFFPQDNNITPTILGTTAALLYFSNLYLVTYRNTDYTYKQILADATFFVCINLLGLYFRYVNEIFMRRTFLDKRACIESTLKLDYEKEREEQLMLSILPRHLASRVRKDLARELASNKTGKRMLNNPYTELYVERHNDVSILYADVVNYTKMTSSLPVSRLVEILNELFGRFDEASEKHKVLRIKFLGDCYYCVSGGPQPNPDHARSCVDLALEMINIIKDVREANDLNVDMRIGIHSGSIMCGIIGKLKWQYDVWSKDVIIANHMEQSGRSGMVHITRQTLNRLGQNYNVEPGYGHMRDELLAKCNIETFFIIPESKINLIPPAGIQTSLIWRVPAAGQLKPTRKMVFQDSNNNENKRLKGGGTDALYSLRRVVTSSGHIVLSGRRKNLIESDHIMHQQQLKMADANIEKDIDKLPIGKFNGWFGNDKVHYLCLGFEGNRQWERPYLKQPDPLFKYHVAAALFVFFCISSVQCLAFVGWSPLSYSVCGVSALILLALLPLTWTHFVWNGLRGSDQSGVVPPPENRILKFFYRVSQRVIFSAVVRMVLYAGVCLLLALCFTTRLFDLRLVEPGPDTDASERLAKYTAEEFIGSWQMTEVCSLAILMSFLFFRIHFQLKLIIASLISATYIYCIYTHKVAYDESETWNPDVPSVTAHILSVLFLVLELHLVDRQTEFVSRLDYCWKEQLVEEKGEVESTRNINKVLLQNILPIHVAEIYLNTNRSSNELYCENYESVSVMFASLTNYSLYNETDIDAEATERQSLHILNRIVCDFDYALQTKEFKRVEKIKVAGWSYMAACGLVPGSRNSSDFPGRSDNRVILIIARFAAEMMRILRRINQEHSSNFGLRVGIAHGPVMAGVVGSHKPYYDIWGDTVNVASRMDSTGEAGKIQVPQETAEILQGEGVECNYRDNIFVKGKGNMDTYYVQLTEDSFLEENEPQSSM